MELNDYIPPTNTPSAFETTTVTTTPLWQLPDGKFLVVTSTHITRVVDNPTGTTLLPDLSGIEAPERVVQHLSEYPAASLPPRPVAEVAARSRNRVKNACAHCNEVRKTCDAARPCKRCQKDGVECKERVRKQTPIRGRKTGKNATRRGPRISGPTTELATDGPAVASTSTSVLSTASPIIPVETGGPVNGYRGNPGQQDAWFGLDTDPFLAQLGWVPPAGEADYGAPLQATSMVHNLFTAANDLYPRL